MFKIHHLLKALVCGVTILFISCDQERSDKIVYTISPGTSVQDTNRIKVRMQFTPNPSGLTKILYDDEAWGQTDLFDGIFEPKALHPGAVVTIEKDSGWIKVEHPTELNQLEFSYEIQQSNTGSGIRDESYRPIVQPSYFHVFAHNLFMLPAHLGGKAEDTLHLGLQWKDFPKEYTVHNSFGSKLRKQELSPISVQKFHSAIFVGGDFRVHHRTLKGNDVYLASRGDWIPFTDSTVVSVLVKTLEVQRDFWKDHSQNYFTVTMRPIMQELGSSFQGTGLTNSFATAISNNDRTDIEQLVYLFNHELQHNWIGLAIENENEEEQYWFSEGFTDYYTIKNIGKNKINGLASGYFISQLNQTIRDLYASPVREAPNSEINYQNFWTDRDYGKLPYQRGMLFAFYLDRTIIRDSKGKHSLDTVMLQLLEASKKKKKLTHDHFIATVNPYLQKDITPFFKAHIEAGKWLPLESLFRNLELQFETECDIFELGFQLDDKKEEVIEVVEGSEACKAGLRKGDRVGSRSIYFGNTDEPVELTILRNGAKKEISYVPVRKASIPQLTISEHNAKILP